LAIVADALSYKEDIANPTTWSHTCAAGAVLYVAAIWEGSATATGCTYNGDALTHVDTESLFDTWHVSVWRITAPDTGANNIVFSFSATPDTMAGYGRSWTGVDTTTPNRTAVGASDISTTVSVTNANAQNGDLAVDFVRGNGAMSTNVGQTQDHTDSSVNGGSMSATTSHEACTGSVTMSHTMSEGAWASIVVPLVPASGGGGTVAGPLVNAAFLKSKLSALVH
jgi:hypothetical protein